MRNPLDPFSRVVDGQSHWDPEWYSWLQEVSTKTTQLEAATAALQTATTALQTATTTLQATSPPGLVFLQTQTITSPVAAIDFTGLGTTHPYNIFLFEGVNLTQSVNDSAIFLRYSIDNGASFFTTGYYYDLIYHYQSAGGSTAIASIGANIAYHQITHGQTTPYATHFTLRAYGASAVIAYSLFLSQSGHYHTGGNGIMQISSAGIVGSGSFNALRFLPHLGGTINSGSITMYGVRKT